MNNLYTMESEMAYLLGYSHGMRNYALSKELEEKVLQLKNAISCHSIAAAQIASELYYLALGMGDSIILPKIEEIKDKLGRSYQCSVSNIEVNNLYTMESEISYLLGYSHGMRNYALSKELEEKVLQLKNAISCHSILAPQIADKLHCLAFGMNDIPILSKIEKIKDKLGRLY